MGYVPDAAVLDRFEIVEMCVKMHWYVDRKDWRALEDVFAPMVRWPVANAILHSDSAAVPGVPDADRFPAIAREHVIASLEALMGDLLTQHIVAGHHAVVDGDTARCRAHSYNMHIGPPQPADNRLVHANLYEFALVRTAEGWRISGLDVVMLWGQGNEAVHANVGKQATVLAERLNAS